MCAFLGYFCTAQKGFCVMMLLVVILVSLGMWFFYHWIFSYILTILMILLPSIFFDVSHSMKCSKQCYHISAMASPWRISVAEFQTTATTRRWRIGFRMAAHGGRYCHGGAVTDIGDIQNICRQRSLKELM